MKSSTQKWYFKLCASFHSHQWIQTGNAHFGLKSMMFVPGVLEIWQMTLKNNRALLLCHIKLCASFRCHICEFKLEWQSRNAKFGSKSTIFVMWPWNLMDDMENNWVPLYDPSSFVHNFTTVTGVTVREWLRGVLTSVTLTFDIWPWPFAWTSLLSMIITPDNLMMILWQEHCQKGVTDRRMDGRTEGWTTIHRAAWLQLKWRSYVRLSMKVTWKPYGFDLWNACNLEKCYFVPIFFSCVSPRNMPMIHCFPRYTAPKKF